MKKKKVEKDNLKFDYYIDVDYSRSNCSDPECDHDYGRCSTIDDISINTHSLTLNNISQPIIKFVEDVYSLNIQVSVRSLLEYAIERIAINLKLFDPDCYVINVQRGYYGEEIGSVTLYNDYFCELIKHIEACLNTSNIIDYLLILEYGEVLPQLLNKKWEVDLVPIDSIVPCQREHFLKVRNKDEKYYNNYDGILGICLKDADIYRLIDGYHRLVEYKNRKDSNLVPIIVNKD